MSEIKRGDLVMVVRPTQCCGSHKSIGKISVVIEIRPDQPRKCSDCGLVTGGKIAVCSDGSRLDLYRLKKIDPPATGEYDGVAVRKTQPKEVTA